MKIIVLTLLHDGGPYHVESSSLVRSVKIIVLTLLHDGGPYHVESSSLVLSVNMQRAKEFLSLKFKIVFSFLTQNLFVPLCLSILLLVSEWSFL